MLARRVVVFALLLMAARGATAAEVSLSEAEKRLGGGRYEDAATAARAAMADGETFDWRLTLIRALVATGQREAAAREVKPLLARAPGSLQALWLARQVFRAAGDEAAADAALDQMTTALATPGIVLESSEELVAAGEVALLRGEEPKTVLATYFEAALTRDGKCKAAYLAGGALALAKSDDRTAATWFQRGLDKLGPDADLYVGLARAHQQGERAPMLAALDAALHLNPRHVEALALRAEHEIDGEDYGKARETLERAAAVDAGAPVVWALRAVLAHLQNDAAAEAKARAQALLPWAKDPAVDTLIGRKLAEKYRFAEAAAYQRRALALDPTYLPAKGQLAQDLLRLPEEGGGQKRGNAGWALAKDVHAHDGYDVAAFNLVTLRDHLDRFTTLRRPGFVVRMESREARVYGDEVLGLLDEASRALDGKYGFVHRHAVEVEIFPDQGDFAVRTFGMPGGSGYLGVCFGSLITMNSPAGTGAAPVSWRSVLWHEYTHVITLGLTGNRIPRWLSEGISVHEEMRRDARWGQSMTGAFRRMILGGELLPIGKLSTAFLSARSSDNIMFAYYQSALAVDFLVERHGLPALRAVLGDLGRGVELNQALATRMAPLADLDKGFAAFARARAEAFAPKADFDELGPGVLADARGRGLDDVLRGRPNSVPALLEKAQRHVDKGEWAAAAPLLERVIALAPGRDGDDAAYLQLAEVMRRLGRAADERQWLEALANKSAGVATAYRRLIELGEGAADRGALAVNAERLLAVNPMLEAGWRARGRALETQDPAGAVRAYQRLLLLEPSDTADTHLRLGRLLRGRDRQAARRHVLEALAEAPRLLPAHRLLLELADGDAAGAR